MDTTAKNPHALRGEWMLALAVCINSFGVVLMLYSGAGISAISSVPFAFSQVFPRLTLGTWTYLFQGLLILSLMVMRKRFVPPYLFSFVVGFVFSELLDVHELWIGILPTALPWRILYFAVSYVLLCIGIALSNRCGLPIIPTDLFPRELADITGVSYPKIKIGFDVTCLAVTAGLTFFCLGHLEGWASAQSSPHHDGSGHLRQLDGQALSVHHIPGETKGERTMKPLRLLVTYTAKSGQRDAFLRAVLQSGVPETSGRRTAVCGTTIFCRQNVRMRSC